MIFKHDCTVARKATTVGKAGLSRSPVRVGSGRADIAKAGTRSGARSFNSNCYYFAGVCFVGLSA